MYLRLFENITMKKTIPLDEDISLKALVRSDAITMYRIIDQQRTYLGRWLPFVQFTHHLHDIKAFVETAIADRRADQDFVYKIVFQGHLIGLIGTKETDPVNKSTELGYWLSEAYQHRGIMTRAVGALVDALFAERRIERIQICCATENTKSIAIPKRLGFQLEGIKRSGEWIGGNEFRDLFVFSSLRAEYASSRSSSVALGRQE